MGGKRLYLGKDAATLGSSGVGRIVAEAVVRGRSLVVGMVTAALAVMSLAAPSAASENVDGAVQGTVSFADGTPAASVVVTLNAPASDQVRRVVTDGGGRFVAQAPAGAYYVSANDSHQPTRFDTTYFTSHGYSTTRFPEASTVRVGSGASVSVDVVVATRAVWSGRVVRAGGHPVKGANIKVITEAGGSMTYFNATDAQGYYAIDHEGGRPLVLQATKGAYIGERVVASSRAKVRTLPVITAVRAGKISVKVVGSRDGMKASEHFYLKSSDGRIIERRFVNARRGKATTVTFDGLAPGQYRVGISGHGRSNVVKVAAGKTSRPKSFVIGGRGLTVEAIVVRANGKPVKDADVEICDVHDTCTGTLSWTDGSFYSSGHAAGRYTVAVRSGGGKTAMQTALRTLTAKKGTVKPGRITLSRARKITVTVRNENGRPVPDVVVSVGRPSVGYASGGKRTSRSGKASFGSQPVHGLRVTVEDPYNEYAALSKVITASRTHQSITVTLRRPR